MNRKEIINFCNEKIFPQCELFALDINGMQDCIKIISKYRIGKHADIEMNPLVKNGFLYMNGEPLGRIARKDTCVSFSDEAYYYEGKILESCGLQEAHYGNQYC